MTVDTDDLRHLPAHQGHPTRSKAPFEGSLDRLSKPFTNGWNRFLDWMGGQEGAVTLFVISDLFEQDEFPTLLAPERSVQSTQAPPERMPRSIGSDELVFPPNAVNPVGYTELSVAECPK